MTTTSPHDALIEKMARTICETQNVDGFKCTCPLLGEPPGNDWCNGNRAIAQARAALAVVIAHYADPANVSDGMANTFFDVFDGAAMPADTLSLDAAKIAFAAAMKSTLTES
jgi:hypothetical protein